MKEFFDSSPASSWIVCHGSPPVLNWAQFESHDPAVFQNVQSKAMKVLARRDKCACLAEALFDKAEVTLHSVAPEGLPINWFGPLTVQLDLVSLFLRMCWLRTMTGGWCMGVRLQSVQNRSCVLVAQMSEMSCLII